MKYNNLGKTNLKISQIGLGCEHLQGKPYETVKNVIDAAAECGINFMDVFMSEPQIRSDIGKAISNNREKWVIQGHIGSIWKNGQYLKNYDLDACKFFFNDLLERLNTDYIDIGFLHFVDTQEDFENVFNSEIIKYTEDLKQKGIIKTIGMSSHNPVIAKKAIKTGFIDVLMFSINPLYDFLPENVVIDDYFDSDVLNKKNLTKIDNERAELYAICEKMQVGIVSMKTFAGGMLFNKDLSAFGFAVSPYQCIEYVLSRPAVKSAMIGCVEPNQVKFAVDYENACDSEKDFSSIFENMKKYNAKNFCVYCNHCLPCPQKIDIAQVNKYLDLAFNTENIPETIKEHYKNLEKHATDCIKCKQCEERCPFNVKITEKMENAELTFGY